MESHVFISAHSAGFMNRDEKVVNMKQIKMMSKENSLRQV